MVKLRHKPISNQRSIIPRSTPSMEGGTATALTLKRHQDWDFVFRLIKNGAKFAYCHEPLATWWNEDDPNRVSKQKSIEPPLLWLKVGSAAIAKDAATAFYFRDPFGKH